MAPSTNHLSLLFLLFLVSSLQISARESQFFSKVTPYNNNNDNSNSNNNNDNNNYNSNNKVEETKLPPKEVKGDEEPAFTTETNNGYGLYGHGKDQFPSTSTTTNEAHYTDSKLPGKTAEEFTGESYKYKEPNKYTYYNNNNNGYVTKQYSLSDTRFQEDVNNNNNNGYPYYNNNNKWDPSKKEGLSDTRFLENGRYSYDVNSENYYPNGNKYVSGRNEGYGSSNSKGADSRNQYNYGGYYGNNDLSGNLYVSGRSEGFGSSNSRGVDSRNQYNSGGYYGNNENGYESNNSMDGYQNQNLGEENQEGYVP